MTKRARISETEITKQNKRLSVEKSEQKPPSLQDRKILAEKAAHFGCTVHDVSGDGNCFFYACGDQYFPEIFRENTVSAHYMMLRQKVAREMKDNFEYYSHFIISETEEEKRNYIKNIKKNKEWVGDDVARAMAMALKITVVIISSQDNMPLQIFKPKTSEKIIVLGHSNGNHYQSLRILDKNKFALLQNEVTHANFLEDYPTLTQTSKATQKNIASTSISLETPNIDIFFNTTQNPNLFSQETSHDIYATLEYFYEPAKKEIRKHLTDPLNGTKEFFLIQLFLIERIYSCIIEKKNANTREKMKSLDIILSDIVEKVESLEAENRKMTTEISSAYLTNFGHFDFKETRAASANLSGVSTFNHRPA